MLGFVTLPDRSPPLELGRLARGRCSVEHEDELQPIIGDEPRCSIEQAGKMRRDAALRVGERRPVAQTDQREELIQLAVAVDGQRSSAQILQRNRLLGDDGSQDHAHAGQCNLQRSTSE